MSFMKSKQTTSSRTVSIKISHRLACAIRVRRTGLVWLALCLLVGLLILPVAGCGQASDVRASVDDSPPQALETDTETVEAASTTPSGEPSDNNTQNETAVSQAAQSKQAQPASKQTAEKKSGSTSTESESKNPNGNVVIKQSELSESERRLNSIAKSYEKEDRPEKPSFDGRASKNGAISFDDLKFEMKKSERFKRAMLTDSVKELVGERLQIKGYIHPNSKKREIKKFIFVRDDKECCFGPTAALYDCMLVSLAEGEKSKYSLRPVTVEGEFYLEEFNGPDGRVWAVYRIKNGVIKK